MNGTPNSAGRCCEIRRRLSHRTREIDEATALLIEVLAIQHAAATFALRGRSTAAAQLLGYVDRVLGKGFTRDTTERRVYETLTSEFKQRLTPGRRKRFALLW